MAINPLSKRTTWLGLVVVIVGSLVELFVDPAMLSSLASLIGPEAAAKVGTLVALVGGVIAALGRALGDPIPDPPLGTPPTDGNAP